MHKFLFGKYKQITTICLIVLIFSFVLSCKNNQVNKENNENPEEIYSAGEIVVIPNKLEISLQSIDIMKGIKLASSLDNAKDFPFVYVKKNKEDTRIIKIKEDGNTVDTIVERADSNIYQNAYIVENGGDTSKTIAQYVLYTDESNIKPKNPNESFAVVSLTLKNISKKPINLKDIKMTIKGDDKEEKDLDLILSDVILSSSLPEVLDNGKSYSLRLIGLVPSSEKSLILDCSGKKFRWDIK